MKLTLISGITLTALLSIYSCKHDFTGPTTPPMEGLCDLDSVYFQNQIMPILISNCTESGCHNQKDCKAGIALNSYSKMLSTVASVTSNDWKKNKLIKSLEDGRMPQNKPRFSTEQINVIKAWVTQGASNNACDENFSGCDLSTEVAFSSFINPLIANYCKGCHSGSNPNGNISLENYQDIRSIALDGRLYNSLVKSSNWMPKGGARLDDCRLQKIQSWIDAGAPQN
ncbi:MAG: hypothetical protein R3A50_14280 [Saprospiraceae bacterium]